MTKEDLKKEFKEIDKTAEELMDKEQWEEAYEFYKNIEDRFSGVTTYWTHRALVSINAGQKSKAVVKYFKRALEIDSKDTHALISFARYYFFLNQYDKSRELLEKVHEIDSKNIDVLSDLAIIAGKQKQIDKQISYLEKILTIDQKRADIWSELNKILRERKEFDKVIANYEKITEIMPDQSAAWYNLGYGYFNLVEENEKAIEPLEKANKMDPKEFVYARELGTAYLLNDKLAKAIDAFERAIKLDKFDELTWQMLIGVYNSIGEKQKADECAKRAKKALSSNPKPWLEKAKQAMDGQRIEEAMICYTKVLEIEPENYVAAFNLASLYRRIGIPHKAIELFKRCLKKNEEMKMQWPLLSQLGELFLKVKDFEQAIKYYEIAVEKDGGKVYDVLNNLGVAYTNVNKYEKAIETFEKIIEHKQDAQAFYLIGNVYKLMNQFQKALEKYLEALETNNFHIPSLLSSSDLYYKFGMRENAIEQLEQALLINPNQIVWESILKKYKEELKKIQKEQKKKEKKEKKKK